MRGPDAGGIDAAPRRGGRRRRRRTRGRRVLAFATGLLVRHGRFSGARPATTMHAQGRRSRADQRRADARHGSAASVKRGRSRPWNRAGQWALGPLRSNAGESASDGWAAGGHHGSLRFTATTGTVHARGSEVWMSGLLHRNIAHVNEIRPRRGRRRLRSHRRSRRARTRAPRRARMPARLRHGSGARSRPGPCGPPGR